MARGVATPYLRRISLAWYSWIFICDPCGSVARFQPGLYTVHCAAALTEVNANFARKWCGAHHDIEQVSITNRTDAPDSQGHVRARREYVRVGNKKKRNL
jgi:hypothetical protein